jgi:hypothetical protein
VVALMQPAMARMSSALLTGDLSLPQLHAFKAPIQKAAPASTAYNDLAEYQQVYDSFPSPSIQSTIALHSRKRKIRTCNLSV